MKKLLDLKIYKSAFMNSLNKYKKNKNYILEINGDFKTKKTYIYFNRVKKVFGINISFNLALEIILDYFVQQHSDLSEEDLMIEVLNNFYFFYMDYLDVMIRFLYMHEYNHFSRFHCSSYAQLFPFKLREHQELLNIIFDLQINEPLAEEINSDTFKKYDDFINYLKTIFIFKDSLISSFEEKSDSDEIIQKYSTFLNEMELKKFNKKNVLSSDIYNMFVNLLKTVFDEENALDNDVFEKWITFLFLSEDNKSKSSDREIKNVDGSELGVEEQEIVENELSKLKDEQNEKKQSKKGHFVGKININYREMVLDKIIKDYFNFSEDKDKTYKKSYRRLNRRQDFYKTFLKKGIVRNENKRKTIVNMIIDTSFSMSYEDYEKIFGLLQKISEKYDNIFRIGFGGNYITKYLETKDLYKIESIFDEVSRGGTNLDYMLNQYCKEYKDKFVIKKRDTFKNIIIFTDGYDSIDDVAPDLNKLYICTETEPNIRENIPKGKILVVEG